MNDKDKTSMTMNELFTYDMNTIIQIHDIKYGKIPYSKVSLYNACKW